MGLEKRHDGYRSFGYLKEGRDYRAFELAKQVGRVEPWLVELSDQEEARAERLARENVLISFHEHLGVFPARVEETPEYIRQGRMATAFEGLAASWWDAVFDNLTDGVGQIHSARGWKWTEVVHDLGMRLCDLAHQDFVVPATGVADILRAHREGKVAWIASIEGSAMIENELDRIEVLYGLGVRALGITYSEANALGSGLKEERDGGLTAFGRKAVERMNKVGMLIDCSHCGDQTTLDVIEASERPVVLSHIGARALWDSNRLAPDAVLEACAARGGVIGIEAAPHTTISATRPVHTLDSFMEHFEYVVGLVGIDHVAFGPDTLYGDHVELHRLYADGLALDESRGSSVGRKVGVRRATGAGRPAASGVGAVAQEEAGSDGAASDGADSGGGGDRGAASGPAEGTPTAGSGDFPRVEHVQGIENPTEGSKNILRWLVRQGYKDDEIAKAMGGNVLRVLREAWR